METRLARLDLDLRTAPFTPERIRPLLAKTTVREITGAQFWVLLLFALFALTFVFGAIPDRWMGMTVAMGIVLAAPRSCLLFDAA